MVENKKIPEDAIYLRTKFPQWNEEDKTFLVDFEGRVRQKSAKNYQLMVILYLKFSIEEIIKVGERS